MATSTMNNLCKKRLAATRKLPENQFCSECGIRDTTWALLVKVPSQSMTNASTRAQPSTDGSASPVSMLGAFICYQCCSALRSLGTHICIVKSVHLDSWTLDQVHAMQICGNDVLNSIWEAFLFDERLSLRGILYASQDKTGDPSPAPTATDRLEFARRKYHLREYFNAQLLDDFLAKQHKAGSGNIGSNLESRNISVASAGVGIGGPGRKIRRGAATTATAALNGNSDDDSITQIGPQHRRSSRRLEMEDAMSHDRTLSRRSIKSTATGITSLMSLSSSFSSEETLTIGEPSIKTSRGLHRRDLNFKDLLKSSTSSSDRGTDEDYDSSSDCSDSSGGDDSSYCSSSSEHDHGHYDDHGDVESCTEYEDEDCGYSQGDHSNHSDSSSDSDCASSDADGSETEAQGETDGDSDGIAVDANCRAERRPSQTLLQAHLEQQGKRRSTKSNVPRRKSSSQHNMVTSSDVPELGNEPEPSSQSPYPAQRHRQRERRSQHGQRRRSTSREGTAEKSETDQKHHRRSRRISRVAPPRSASSSHDVKRQHDDNQEDEHEEEINLQPSSVRPVKQSLSMDSFYHQSFLSADVMSFHVGDEQQQQQQTQPQRQTKERPSQKRKSTMEKAFASLPEMEDEEDSMDDAEPDLANNAAAEEGKGGNEHLAHEDGNEEDAEEVEDNEVDSTTFETSHSLLDLKESGFDVTGDASSNHGESNSTMGNSIPHGSESFRELAFAEKQERRASRRRARHPIRRLRPSRSPSKSRSASSSRRRSLVQQQQQQQQHHPRSQNEGRRVPPRRTASYGSARHRQPNAHMGRRQRAMSVELNLANDAGASPGVCTPSSKSSSASSKRRISARRRGSNERRLSSHAGETAAASVVPTPSTSTRTSLSSYLSKHSSDEEELAALEADIVPPPMPQSNAADPAVPPSNTKYPTFPYPGGEQQQQQQLQEECPDHNMKAPPSRRRVSLKRQPMARLYERRVAGSSSRRLRSGSPRRSRSRSSSLTRSRRGLKAGGGGGNSGRNVNTGRHDEEDDDERALRKPSSSLALFLSDDAIEQRLSQSRLVVDPPEEGKGSNKKNSHPRSNLKDKYQDALFIDSNHLSTTPVIAASRKKLQQTKDHQHHSTPCKALSSRKLARSKISRRSDPLPASASAAAAAAALSVNTPSKYSRKSLSTPQTPSTVHMSLSSFNTPTHETPRSNDSGSRRRLRRNKSSSKKKKHVEPSPRGVQDMFPQTT